MRHQRTRLRKKEREGVVVDMVFTSEQLRFPVWHFRFKDCAEVSLDDVATEVGIAQGFGNRVAIIAGTGRTSNAARKYAALVNSKTAFQVAIIGRRDLVRSQRKPSHLVRLIGRQAPLALLAKDAAE